MNNEDLKAITRRHFFREASICVGVTALASLLGEGALAAASGGQASRDPLLPHLASVADDIAIIRSLRTDQFNHAPAQIFLNTGSALPGRPSMGS